MEAEATANVRASQRSYKGCCWYGFLLLLILPLAAALIAVGLLALQDRSAQAEAAELVGKLEAEGLAVTPQSQHVAYLEQTDDKYLRDWEEIFSQFQSDKFLTNAEDIPLFGLPGDPEVPSPGEPWEHRQATVDFLAKYDRLYLKVRRLCFKQLEPGAKYVRLPVEFNSRIQFQAWNELRQPATMLALSGHMAIDRRDSAAVRRDILALLGASRVASPKVNINSAFINNSIDGLTLSVLERALEEAVLATSDINALLPLFMEEAKVGQNWREMLAGETAFGLACFENPELFEGPSIALPFRGNDKVLYLQSMRSLMDAPTEELSDFYTTSMKSTTTLSGADTPIEMFNSVYSNFSIASRQAVIAFETRRATKCRQLIVAMRLRIYEEEFDSMPRSLSDVQALDLSIVEPAGGMPFGYQNRGTEVILWWDHDFGPTPETPPEVGERDILEAYSQTKLKIIEPAQAK